LVAAPQANQFVVKLLGETRHKRRLAVAFGKIIQEINYDKPAAETLIDLERALGRIGKVKSVDPTTQTINGSTRFGLQSVKIEATVTGDETGSVISLIGKSDDARGVGAKNGLERLIATLGNVDDPDFEVSKTGFDRPTWILWGYVLLGAVGILAVAITLTTDADWVSDNMVVIGFLVAAYLWGFSRVFKRN
jgi:hypothetical protein